VSGPFKKPALTGWIRLNHAGVTTQNPSLAVSNVNGALVFAPNTVSLNDLTGRLAGNVPWSLSGVVQRPFDALAQKQWPGYQLHVQAQQVALNSIQSLLQKTPEMAETLKSVGPFNGLLSVNLQATGQPQPQKQTLSPGLEGTVLLTQVQAHPPQWGAEYPLRLDKLLMTFNRATGGTIQPTQGFAGPIPFDLAGRINPKRPKDMDIRVNTPWLATAILKAHYPFFKTVTGADFKIPARTEGTFQFSSRITGEGPHGHMAFRDATLGWPNLPDIHGVNGGIVLHSDPKKGVQLASDNLRFHIGQLQFAPKFQALLVQSKGAEQSSSKTPLGVTGTFVMPMTAWVTNPQTQTLEQKDFGTLTASTDLYQQHLQLLNATLSLTDMGQLVVDGGIDHPFQDDQRAFIVTAKSPAPINLGPLGQYFEPVSQSAGSIALDVTASGHNPDDALLFGTVQTEKLAFSALRLLGLTATTTLNGVDGELLVQEAKVPGVDVGITAHIEDTAEFPFQLTDVAVSGKEFIVPAWEAYQRDIIDDIVMKQFMEPLFGPPKPTDPLLAFEFRDGQLHLDEVVYDNIIINNLNGQLSLSRDGFFRLKDATASVTDGSVALNLSQDPKRNGYTVIDLTAKHLNANALMLALLNAPNQVFGDMDGHIQITTEGLTEEAATRNANGKAEFVIENGRLPAIAKIETLLAAANTFRGGITGVNLNNLFRSLSVFKTNYFAELSGSLDVHQGVGYTDDLLSDGDDLDLLIQGHLGLADAQGQLAVYGTMSQNVSGMLGKVGNLSLKSVLRFVPGIGFIPGSERGGLLSYIPGVGFVPGLGGPGKQKNRFKVTIDGSLNDPQGAVQGFEWLP